MKSNKALARLQNYVQDTVKEDTRWSSIMLARLCSVWMVIQLQNEPEAIGLYYNCLQRLRIEQFFWHNMLVFLREGHCSKLSKRAFPSKNQLEMTTLQPYVAISKYVQPQPKRPRKLHYEYLLCYCTHAYRLTDASARVVELLNWARVHLKVKHSVSLIIRRYRRRYVANSFDVLLFVMMASSSFDAWLNQEWGYAGSVEASTPSYRWIILQGRQSHQLSSTLVRAQRNLVDDRHVCSSCLRE